MRQALSYVGEMAVFREFFGMYSILKIHLPLDSAILILRIYATAKFVHTCKDTCYGHSCSIVWNRKKLEIICVFNRGIIHKDRQKDP